jgi:DNA transposition AAA+ family ATPase
MRPATQPGRYALRPVNGRVAPSQARRDLFKRRFASLAWNREDETTDQGNCMTERKDAAVEPQELDVAQLREQLRQLLDTERLPQGRVAKEANVSATTLSQWLNNIYQGDNVAIAAKLQQWLTAWIERNSRGGLPEGPEWVETPSALRVVDGLRYAQIAQDMVVIYGGAGTGKTKGIEHHVRTSRNVFHATMSPATATVNACLEAIVEALGIREYAKSTSGMHRAICARLKDTRGVLVIDEAQHLDVKALDQVRSIHDAVRIGVALVGNENVYSRMTGGNRAPYLDRLFSRIGKRIHLKRSSDGDVDAIVKAWGIKDLSCQQQIREIAAKPGALRVLNKVLRLGAAYAKAADREICCDDVRAAWRELGGLD